MELYKLTKMWRHHEWFMLKKCKPSGGEHESKYVNVWVSI